jgi:hypothetical protein
MCVSDDADYGRDHRGDVGLCWNTAQMLADRAFVRPEASVFHRRTLDNDQVTTRECLGETAPATPSAKAKVSVGAIRGSHTAAP